MATWFILTTIKVHFHKMLSELTVNFWKFVKSANGYSVQNLKPLLWIRGIYVELCHFHKCYAISLMCLKKKKKTTWKHPNRDSCQQQTWITSLEDKVLCWSCQISPPAEDKSNKYESSCTLLRQSVQSLIFSTVRLRFNPFLYLKKDRVRKPVTVGSCWWNVTSGELKGFNTLRCLVFLHIIPEARKSTELMNGHHLRSDRRWISWTSGTVNVTVAHQWTAQTQVHPYVLALLFRKKVSWSWYKPVVRSQRVESQPPEVCFHSNLWKTIVWISRVMGAIHLVRQRHRHER